MHPVNRYNRFTLFALCIWCRLISPIPSGHTTQQQRLHYVQTTSPTSFWRNEDVIIASLLRHVSVGYPSELCYWYWNDHVIARSMPANRLWKRYHKQINENEDDVIIQIVIYDYHHDVLIKMEVTSLTIISRIFINANIRIFKQLTFHLDKKAINILSISKAYYHHNMSIVISWSYHNRKTFSLYLLNTQEWQIWIYFILINVCIDWLTKIPHYPLMVHSYVETTLVCFFLKVGRTHFDATLLGYMR